MASKNIQSGSSQKPTNRCIEYGPECWEIGKKVAVLYDDGKWYPAEIKSFQAGKDEPYTLMFETGETVDTKLPDKDIRPLPDEPCDVCNKDECFEDDLLIRSSHHPTSQPPPIASSAAHPPRYLSVGTR